MDQEYKYCPRCKSDLVNTRDYFECKKCGLIIYKNSAPTSSILLIEGGKVLLAKRAIQPFEGKYDVIGGFLKYGEDPIKGVIREVREETGLKVKIIQFLGIYMDIYGKGGKAILNIYYIGKIISGKIKAHDDVASLEWFSINNLPHPAFKNQEEVFRDLQKWYLELGHSSKE